MKRQPKRKHPTLKRKTIDANVRRECQREFLIAASKHEEIRLVDSLHDEVFSKFPDGDELERFLLNWADHPNRNLAYPWVLDAARNLYHISWIPHYRRLAKKNFETSLPAHSPQPFLGTPWVLNDDIDRYENRLRTAFEEFLTDWIKQCNGIRKRSKQKHRRQGTYSGRYHKPDHYRWAAEYVCLKRGWTEIAKTNQLGIYIQGVTQAVNKVLDDIGIPRGM
jgi:hypothetical protein